MFRLLLFPANPAKVTSHLKWSGIVGATSGSISLAILLDIIRRTFPEEVLKQLPEYEHFIYMAFAASVLTVLPLIALRNVLCLSLAEFGVATSLVYFGYSLMGVFLPGYKLVFGILLILIVTVLTIAFSSGLSFAWKERSWSDFMVGVFFTLLIEIVWLYPLYRTWRYL